MGEILGSASDENDDGYEDWNPAVALVDVKEFIAAERDDECDDAGDDNTNVDADSAVTYGSQSLATYDSSDNRETSHGCSVEKQDDANAKETKSISSLDHLSHSSLWPKSSHIRRRNCRQQREKDDNERGITKTQAKGECSEHSSRDSIDSLAKANCLEGTCDHDIRQKT